MRSLLVAAAAVLVLRGSCAAAQPSSDPGPRRAFRQQQMQERLARRAEDLKIILRIRPDQEAAFTAFQASMRPPARPERDGGPPPAALTTPERLAEMDKRLAAREARMHDRTRATLAFYGALSPEQQRVFDALQRLRGRGGGMGGGMGGMRGRWGGGGMGRMGPPFARPPQ